MNNNMVENPKVEVPQTVEMNDRDYLFDVLESTKNMSNNLSTAIDEMSNEHLHNEIFTTFNEVKQAARELFNLAFKLGWYPLEKAEMTKVQEKHTEFTTKAEELPMH